MNDYDIEEPPEPVTPQLEIIVNVPNQLNIFERAMVIFNSKDETVCGKTKSIISMTLVVVLTPIIFVISIPFVIIFVTFFGIFMVGLCIFENCTYFCQKTFKF